MRPKAHAHRAGSILLAMLLLVSMVAAPIGTGTAAAQTQSQTTIECEDDGWFGSIIWVLQKACQHSGVEEVDTSQADSAVMTDLHILQVGEWEGQQRYLTLTNNYVEDTGTMASIDSRNAIATSWENGNTTVQASQNAREAIRDYYARQQIQMLESFSKQMGQAEYTHNVSNQKSGIDDNFLHVGVTGSPDTETSYSTFYDVGMTTLNVSLVNGTSHEIQTAQLGVTMHGNSDWDYHYAVGPFEHWTTLGETKMQTHPVNSQSGAGYSNLTVNTTGSYVIHNVGDVDNGGLPSQRVVDLREWKETWDRIKSQEATLTANYDEQFTEDLYNALDAGEINSTDLRGIEGHVRWMSGDDNVTGERYRQATLSTLGLSNPDLTNASTMVVDYEGFTSQSFNSSNDSTVRDVEYSDYVNETYQGLLFSTEVPDGGFEVNTTYNTDNLNGSQILYDEESGSEVTLAKGNFSIEAMYDDDGNLVNSVSWERPKYDTYNATEFIEYVNTTKVYRTEIIEDDSSGGNGGIDWPDWGTDLGGSGVVAGLAIIVIAAVSAVLLATNVFRR